MGTKLLLSLVSSAIVAAVPCAARAETSTVVVPGTAVIFLAGRTDVTIPPPNE